MENVTSNTIREWNRTGKLIVATKLENALSMSEKYKYNSHIVHGDCPQYWIVTPGVAAKLEAAGYDIVGCRGHLFT